MMKKISVLALLIAVGALSVSAEHKKDEPAKEPDATEMYDKAGLGEEKDKFIKEDEAKAREEDEKKDEDKLAEEKLAEEEKVEEVKDVADKVEEDVKKEDKEEVKD